MCKENQDRLKACPYCGNTHCYAEWCDVGVGLVQIGPYYCAHCHASEIGPFDTTMTSLEERNLGWYAPGNNSEHVCTIQGKVVSFEKALSLYRQGLVEKIPFHI